MDIACNVLVDTRREDAELRDLERGTCVAADGVMIRHLVFAVPLAACAGTPMHSSRAVLAPELAQVLIGKDIRPAAIEVSQTFAMRGFTLAGITELPDGLQLRLTGDRRTWSESVTPNFDAAVDVLEVFEVIQGDPVFDRHHHQKADYTYGSAFYVKVSGRGPSTSQVEVVGRVILNGAELCTPDTPELTTPCVTNDHDLSEVPGTQEAEVIEGVFAELRLHGSVVSEDPHPMVAAREQRSACEERRRRNLEVAGRVSNAKARANILAATPVCDASAGPELVKR